MFNVRKVLHHALQRVLRVIDLLDNLLNAEIVVVKNLIDEVPVVAPRLDVARAHRRALVVGLAGIEDVGQTLCKSRDSVLGAGGTNSRP